MVDRLRDTDPNLRHQATGQSICCDDNSPDCAPSAGGGGGCAANGKVNCRSDGYIPMVLITGAAHRILFAAKNRMGMPTCCQGNGHSNNPSSTTTPQNFASSTSSRSGANRHFFNRANRPNQFRDGITHHSSCNGRIARQCIDCSSRSLPVHFEFFVGSGARGSYSFIFQPAMLFIVIHFSYFVGTYSLVTYVKGEKSSTTAPKITL